MPESSAWPNTAAETKLVMKPEAQRTDPVKLPSNTTVLVYKLVVRSLLVVVVRFKAAEVIDFKVLLILELLQF